MSRSQKNNKRPAEAVIENGQILCPRCHALLGKAYLGASASGIELWCRGRDCRMPVWVKI